MERVPRIKKGGQCRTLSILAIAPLSIRSGSSCFVSEVAGVQAQDFDLKQGLLRFYRPKVDKEQLHRLSTDTWRAARRYVEAGTRYRGTRDADQ